RPPYGAGVVVEHHPPRRLYRNGASPIIGYGTARRSMAAWRLRPLLLLLALCSSPPSAQVTEDHRFSPPAWVTPGRFGDHTHISEDGRTVLALAYLQGGVAFHRTGTGEWVDHPLIASLGGTPQHL